MPLQTSDPVFSIGQFHFNTDGKWPVRDLASN